jgi:uncharacterized protein
MPVQLSYPGVYVEEIPSGVHTIVGVPTSVTAFVGRASKGPLNTPTTCFSYADYVRFFGTPAHDSSGIPFMMSYSVEDFFMNGGGQAVIVRVAQEPVTTSSAANQGAAPAAPAAAGAAPVAGAPAAAAPAAAAVATETATGLSLVAASPGLWGNNLLATVDQNGIKPGATGSPFNLTIQLLDPANPVTERFLNLSTAAAAGTRRLDNVLATQSMLVRVKAGTAMTGQAPTPPAPAKTPPAGQAPVPVRQAAPTPSFSGGADGGPLTPTMVTGGAGTGIGALKNVDIFNLLCIPLEDVTAEDSFVSAYQSASAYCVERRAVMVLDAPSAWVNNVNQQNFSGIDPANYFNFDEDQERNSAVYLPHILRVDQADGITKTFPACGAIAGQMAAVDARRGVWKAPAGIETAFGGIAGLEAKLSDGDNGQLNPIGVNCLRTFPILGSVIWGARTLRGADIMEDDYKYLSVRRLTLFIEESLVRGTKWAVFEPNDETLWASLRTSITSFMAALSNQGAFYDFQVICDKTTTTPDDINLGVVNVIVAFAPVKPAEFVVLKIQQEAGQAPG